MPAYYFKCPKCASTKRRILTVFEKPKCDCGETYDLDPDRNNQSMMVKEVLDNGLMFKKVERIVGVGDMTKERSQQKEEDSEII